MPAWAHNLSMGASLLALGSGLLLVGPLTSLLVRSLVLLQSMGLAAMVMHLAAWWHLGAGALAIPREHAAARIGIASALAASIVAFIFAGSPYLSPWAIYFPIAYLPFVWGPVVLAHAALFGVSVALLDDPRDAGLVLAGVAVLAGLGLIAILSQVQAWSFGGYVFLAGATAAGYGPVALGWWRGSYRLPPEIASRADRRRTASARVL